MEQQKSESPEEVAKDVFQTLQDSGFELHGWGNTTDYNKMIVNEGLEDRLSKLVEGKMIVVAGNSASLWPIIQKYQEETQSRDPFDQYSTQVAQGIQKRFGEKGLKVEIRMPCDISPDTLISFTRLVQGLQHGDGPNCYHQDDIHLLFHEKFGTWHAWRFALIFENLSLHNWSDPVPNKVDHIKEQISQSEIDHAKSVISNLDFNQDTSHIWLQVRQSFNLGKEHQFQKPELLPKSQSFESPSKQIIFKEKLRYTNPDAQHPFSPLEMLKHHYKNVMMVPDSKQ